MRWGFLKVLCLHTKIESRGVFASSRYQLTVSMHLMPTCMGLISIARMGSVYLTMAVTLERYFAIVKPLSHFGLKKYLLPGSLVFSVVYNLPRFFELERSVFLFTNETMVVATDLR